MSYYPDREAYLSDMGDACGRAEENLLNSITGSIEVTLLELKPLLCCEVYKIVREKFEKDFPIRKES